MEEYAWEGPTDGKLDTELWRVPKTKDDEEEDPLENSFTRCFAQSNMMTTEEREERRWKHLEARRKVSEVEELVREESPENVRSSIIKHQVAAGEDYRKAMSEETRILCIGTHGEGY